MKKKTFSWKNLSEFFRAFLFVAAAFLLLGLGTLGSVQTTGESYVLQTKQGSDKEEPYVIFELQLPEDIPSKSRLVLREVYLNAGTIYSETGTAELRLGRRGSVSADTTASNFTAVRAKDGSDSGSLNLKLANPFSSAAADEKAVRDATFNWIAPFVIREEGYALNSYPYYCISAKNCNVMINEIVFACEELDENDEPTGKIRAVEAKVHEYSLLPIDADAGETKQDALDRASAMVDKPRIPALSQSSFFRYGQDELYSLATVAEMRMGGEFLSTSVYKGDRVYNSLGADLTAFGTVIFGMSPFGLRFFSALASFGVLVFGFYFVRKLLKSDRAGLIFAVLFSLCSLSLSLAHLGTPLMIGLFFFTVALQQCHRFYADGLKKVDFAGVLALVLSGLFCALSVCVNGLYLLPVLGVAGLFAAGMLRQQKAKRYNLDKAIAEYEAAEQNDGEGAAVSAEEKKKQASAVYREFRMKNIVAPVAFGAALILGLFLFSVLFILPASFAYVKMYDNPAAPSLNIFTLAWKAFAGGFVGKNAANDFGLFYQAFAGSGSAYAVTGICINAVAALAGLFGLGFAVYRLIVLLKTKAGGKEFRAELRAVAIPAAGLLLALVSTLVAAFSGGAFGFLLLGCVFAFALCAGGAETLLKNEKTAKGAKIAIWTTFGLLCAVFLLFAVFTFSVPLPQTFMTKLFG